MPASKPIIPKVSTNPSCDVCIFKDSAVNGCDMSDAVFFARFPRGAYSSGSARSSSGSRTLLFIDFVAVSASQLGFMLAGSRRARKGERKDGGWDGSDVLILYRRWHGWVGQSLKALVTKQALRLYLSKARLRMESPSPRTPYTSKAEVSCQTILLTNATGQCNVVCERRGTELDKCVLFMSEGVSPP